MAEEGEKKEAESKKHTYPLVRVSSSDNYIFYQLVVHVCLITQRTVKDD